MSEKCNQINVTIGKQSQVDVNFSKQTGINLEIGKSAGGGGSYPPLSEKPSINDVVLLGNKTSAEIHVQHEMDVITEQQIDNIIFGG